MQDTGCRGARASNEAHRRRREIQRASGSQIADAGHVGLRR
jgi:hypothetical protein